MLVPPAFQFSNSSFSQESDARRGYSQSEKSGNQGRRLFVKLVAMKSNQRSNQRSSMDAIVAADDENLHGYVAELCKRHLEKYPRDGYIWHQYACTLTELARFDEALRALKNALDFSDQEHHDFIFVSIGEVYFDRADYLKAEKYFLKANALIPNEIIIHDFLGICAFRRGELQSAEERFQHALQCQDDPNNCREEVLFNLGGVLVALEKYEEAAECYQRALALGNKSAPLRLRDIEEIRKLQENT
jgi:tetratricopeptide (TPR) repeat protein